MKRILVGLDASPRAPLVLATAVGIAAKMDARLALLRTVGLPSAIDQEAVTHAASSVLDEMKSAATAELRSLAAGLPPGLVEDVHVHVGTPWDSICREAKELDCDLVVIGSHGYSTIDKLLGTTAAKVVNHCDRSVLVVRPKT